MIRNVMAVAVLVAGSAAQLAPAPALAQGAQRPSFSCAAARGFAERTICADPELARLDRITGELFQETQSLWINAQQIDNAASEQRSWLAKRNRCTDKQCLRQAYFNRIAELVELLPTDS